MVSRSTYDLHILQLVIGRRDNILLLSDMRHVAPIVRRVRYIRRSHGAELKAIHICAIDDSSEVVDSCGVRLVPVETDGASA